MKWMYAALLSLLGVQSLAIGQNSTECQGFRWDVSTERGLFAAADATPLKSSTEVALSPVLRAGELYTLKLLPQEQLNLAVKPSKVMLADGAYAGLFKLAPLPTGSYRIAVDSGAWIDVAEGERTIASSEFSGAADCTSPRKIVVYPLPGERELILQFTASEADTLRVSITPHPDER